MVKAWSVSRFALPPAMDAVEHRATSRSSPTSGVVRRSACPAASVSTCATPRRPHLADPRRAVGGRGRGDRGTRPDLIQVVSGVLEEQVAGQHALSSATVRAWSCPSCTEKPEQRVGGVHQHLRHHRARPRWLGVSGAMMRATISASARSWIIAVARVAGVDCTASQTARRDGRHATTMRVVEEHLQQTRPLERRDPSRTRAARPATPTASWRSSSHTMTYLLRSTGTASRSARRRVRRSPRTSAIRSRPR